MKAMEKARQFVVALTSENKKGFELMHGIGIGISTKSILVEV